MSSTAFPTAIDSGALAEKRAKAAQRWAFGGVCLALLLVSCFVAGWAPIGFSIATVFLFAGPHNWLEARYMLSRMPGRWGPLRIYFLTGIGGVLFLSAGNAGIPRLAAWQGWSDDVWLALIAVWNTLLLGWVAALVLLRSQQNPRRNWLWVVPAALVLVAANWLWPVAWSLALVYLHPLVALWFLDREIGKNYPAWQSMYRGCAAIIPCCLVALWWNLAAVPDLPGTDSLTLQITRHAGGDVMPNLSTHFLVASHTFLEMLHYGVWILAIPLVSIRAAPWKLDNVPLARRSALWRPLLLSVVAGGFAVMLVLWTAFLADYPLTRDIYFTVAMLHVLAEVPFLLRLL